jgi:hypothetical protein
MASGNQEKGGSAGAQNAVAQGAVAQSAVAQGEVAQGAVAQGALDQHESRACAIASRKHAKTNCAPAQTPTNENKV